MKYPLRITLSSFAPVLSKYKNLPFLSQRAPTWKHPLPFRSFFIAELSDGVGMGNQLSTWNLSIQSAVDGENFNYNPDYNQVSLFLSSYLVSNLFSEHSLPACSLQPKGAVLIQASMARLHFLLRLLTYSPTTLGSTSGSERPQAKQIIWIFKIFLWILVAWGQMTTNFLRRCCFAPDLGQHLPWLQVQVSYQRGEMKSESDCKD